MAVRCKRILLDQTAAILDRFPRLPVRVDAPISPSSAKILLRICHRHSLTVYDAAYLDLALREQLSLATLDGDLRKAAESEGVTLL
jgi:predicted nucleic acid-binding protein